MESIGIAHRQEEIEQRLRSRAKALHIARETGISLRSIIRVAQKAGIVLKQGRQKITDDPEQYGKYIDQKFGSGTTDNLRRWRERLTYADIGQALGGISRGSAHYICRCLTGNAPKPTVPHKPAKWQRTDITIGKVRRSARRCLSIAAMERELRVSGEVIYERARDGNITLPNGHLNLATIRSDRRPDITRKRMRRLAKKLPTMSAIAIALNTDIATVKRRAKRFGISLPRYGRPRLAP